MRLDDFDSTIFLIVAQLPVPSQFSSVEDYLRKMLKDKGQWEDEDYSFISPVLRPDVYRAAFHAIGIQAKSESFGMIVTKEHNGEFLTFKGKEQITRVVRAIQMNTDTVRSKANAIRQRYSRIEDSAQGTQREEEASKSTG